MSDPHDTAEHPEEEGPAWRARFQHEAGREEQEQRRARAVTPEVRALLRRFAGRNLTREEQEAKDPFQLLCALVAERIEKEGLEKLIPDVQQREAFLETYAKKSSPEEIALDLLEDNIRLQGENDDLRHTLDSLRQELDERPAEYDRIARRNTGLEHSVSTLSDRLDAAQEELTQANKSLENERAIHNITQGQRADLQEVLNREQARLIDTQTKLGKERRRRAAQENREKSQLVDAQTELKKEQAKRRNWMIATGVTGATAVLGLGVGGMAMRNSHAPSKAEQVLAAKNPEAPLSFKPYGSHGFVWAFKEDSDYGPLGEVMRVDAEVDKQDPWTVHLTYVLFPPYTAKEKPRPKDGYKKSIRIHIPSDAKNKRALYFDPYDGNLIDFEPSAQPLARPYAMIYQSKGGLYLDEVARCFALGALRHIGSEPPLLRELYSEAGLNFDDLKNPGIIERYQGMKETRDFAQSFNIEAMGRAAQRMDQANPGSKLQEKVLAFAITRRLPKEALPHLKVLRQAVKEYETAHPRAWEFASEPRGPFPPRFRLDSRSLETLEKHYEHACELENAHWGEAAPAKGPAR